MDDPGAAGRKDLLAYIKENKSVNTTKKTQRDVLRFGAFIADKHSITTPIHELNPSSLDVYLGEWLMSLEKIDGSPYEPDTLTSFHRSIDRYLRENDYPLSIVSSNEFSVSKGVLATKRKELFSKGMGNQPHKADSLSDSDEERLWISGQLGFHSPQSLFNTVWYFNTKLFGFRGGHETRQMMWGDITLKKDEKGDEYLEFNERLSKTRQGNSSVRAFAPKAFGNLDNPDRCPVRAYKLYRKHRPSQYLHPESPFYVAVNHSWLPHSTSPWFKNSPVGHKILASMLKVMANKAGLTHKKLSNHSLRRTMCTTLLQQRVPPNLIAQLSGHKNIASLQNYSVASFSQQKEMSHILQGVSKTKATSTTSTVTSSEMVLSQQTTIEKNQDVTLNIPSKGALPPLAFLTNCTLKDATINIHVNVPKTQNQ